MNPITIYLLEASICLGVFYLFYLAILHRQPSFRYNRAYLLLTSALGWILPLLEIPFGFGSSSAAASGSTGYFLLSPTEIGEAEAAAGSFSWLAAIYGLGVLAAVAYFARQFYQLYQVVRSSQPQDVPHCRYRLLYTRGKFPTASFFQYLFWDNTQSLTVEETHQMMQHEEAHIRQGHSYDTLYMMLLKTFAWFHPLVYLYDRALTQNHEYSADAAVLQETSHATYARLLSKRMLTAQNVLPVNYFFYSSQILNRIHMLYSRTRRIPWYKYVLIVPVFASLLLTFSCQPDTEEIGQEAVAQSYEEVQNAIAEVDEQILSFHEKYFPTKEDFTDFLDNYRAKNLDNPHPTQLQILEEVASSSDLARFKQLNERAESLREKLMHLPDADGTFTVVENRPEPTDGMEDFYRFIGNNIKYPAEARKAGVEGKVFVQFIINEYGELTEVETLKGIGMGCEEEAMRVLGEAPAWNPGTNDGKAVSVRMVLPVTFKLGNGENEDNKAMNTLSGEDKSSQIDEMVVVGYQ